MRIALGHRVDPAVEDGVVGAFRLGDGRAFVRVLSSFAVDPEEWPSGAGE